MKGGLALGQGAPVSAYDPGGLGRDTWGPRAPELRARGSGFAYDLGGDVEEVGAGEVLLNTTQS